MLSSPPTGKSTPDLGATPTFQPAPDPSGAGFFVPQFPSSLLAKLSLNR